MVDNKADLSNYTSRAGGAALGARLRRLSERIDREVAQFYAELGVEFEQRWYGTLNLLDQFDSLTVGELSEALGIRHVSVSQTRDSLHKAGLVETTADPEDARRRKLSLSRKGRTLVNRLRPAWAALSAAAEALDREAGGVVKMLDRLECALEKRSVCDRAKLFKRAD
ncbi:MarR family transcriptional regulator [Lysobacter maris]|uniref:MarR family transcriptional regulator n=1 Tax=Marilutibacter maris TaxID=1605891 RepID=A0A508A9D8_9GAMM|nr:MarR family transcriptional regulator [Lysobacter maris]KAB8168042.1 MarR family transcriptional regulator [Lysobacter maris]